MNNFLSTLHHAHSLLIKRKATTSLIFFATTGVTNALLSSINPKIYSTPASSINTMSNNYIHTNIPIRRNQSSINLYSQSENEIQMNNDALKISNAAINAVNPKVAVERHLQFHKETSLLTLSDKQDHMYNLQAYDSIIICAFGKAATEMALTTAQIVSPSNIPIRGIVITKYDHATQEQIQNLKSYNIDLHFASHPIPDDQSIQASNLVLDMVRSASSKTLVLNCISGGGSSLFCSPRQPLTLQTMAQVNTQLLACGMPITEMNVIRKKLEIGKGGGLAGLIYPGTSITLVLSDVIHDPLDLIASGPTVPDQSSWVHAWELITKYHLDKGDKYELPQIVIEMLQHGRDGKYDNVQDLPTIDHPMFSTRCINSNNSDSKLSETALVGNNAQAVYAAAAEAQRLGYNPVVLGTSIEGEAVHIANMYITMAEQIQSQRTKSSSTQYQIVALPAAIIGGGETTVTLSQNPGKGGRNQEMGLTAALKLKSHGLRDIVFASIGTDGTDGPTDAAGAIVDGTTINRIECENRGTYFGKKALEQHDAYTFLDTSSETTKNALIKTGPTGTNVADIYFALIK